MKEQIARQELEWKRNLECSSADYDAKIRHLEAALKEEKKHLTGMRKEQRKERQNHKRDIQVCKQLHSSILKAELICEQPHSDVPYMVGKRVCVCVCVRACVRACVILAAYTELLIYHSDAFQSCRMQSAT